MPDYTDIELLGMESRYIKNNGARCPFCNSSSLWGDPVEILDNGATQSVGCISCGATWTDLYKLDRIEYESWPTKED